jgi:DNA invertase Pin-like site-specific DNA recombinase
MISRRTKEALAAAKARGVKLGGARPGQHKLDPQLAMQARIAASDRFAKRVQPIASELHDGGLSLRQIAAELAKRCVQTMRGGAWTAAAVRNVLLRPF